MRFDFAELTPQERYKLLVSLIVPRPIALVSSINETGVVNAAPYSYFNAFSEDPALLVLGLQSRPDKRLKDTARNIAAQGEFVVNLVDAPIVEAMNVCAVDFEEDESEVALAGLTIAASTHIAVPRIAEAPAAFECKLNQTLELANERKIVIGEVMTLHVRDGMIDAETLRLDWSRYDPIGRLYGNLYCRTDEVFELVRPAPDGLRRQR